MRKLHFILTEASQFRNKHFEQPHYRKPSDGNINYTFSNAVWIRGLSSSSPHSWTHCWWMWCGRHSGGHWLSMKNLRIDLSTCKIALLYIAHSPLIYGNTPIFHLHNCIETDNMQQSQRCNRRSKSFCICIRNLHYLGSLL